MATFHLFFIEYLIKSTVVKYVKHKTDNEYAAYLKWQFLNRLTVLVISNVTSKMYIPTMNIGFIKKRESILTVWKQFIKVSAIFQGINIILFELVLCKWLSYHRFGKGKTNFDSTEVRSVISQSTGIAIMCGTKDFSALNSAASQFE